MDSISILNYQGSKKNLLDFIHTNLDNYIESSTTILDIFSGSCSVGYSYKKSNTVYANDSEYYSYIISTALLSNYYGMQYEQILESVENLYNQNLKRQQKVYVELSNIEKNLLSKNCPEELIELYNHTPTIWNTSVNKNAIHTCYELFTTYYSNSYFGITQSMDIDSLRYSFEPFKTSSIYYALLSSLFYAMKECVFSKDGHMAQPLSYEKNKEKLIKIRQKSIVYFFKSKLQEFLSNSFISSDNLNKTFNMNFQELLLEDDIRKNVQFIYADPPYTDMQYSRYYHLLNVVAKYQYLSPTLIMGNPTKGLYLEGRFQSKLSSKSTSFETFKNLIDFSKEYNKSLAISFAYPQNTNTQRTDRYVMNIEDLKTYCSCVFDNHNVEVITKDYLHSNHRNSEPKKVLEYLILCKTKLNK